MKSQSWLHAAILLSSFVGLVLSSALVYKAATKRQAVKSEKSTYVKLDPSKVNQIKIVKAARSTSARKYSPLRRSVSSYDSQTTLRDLFGPYGPLKGLSARERYQFRRQVVSYVDHKIHQGAIAPRQRYRFIEMKVMDKSLEMMEARAEN